MRTDPRTISPNAAAPSSASVQETDFTVQSLPFTQFIWGAGVECSSLPHLNVDQFAWTQHDRFWREDIRRAKDELGIGYLRYAFPWHTLEPRRGGYDWSFSDERMEEFDRLGIKLILDVMHFGTPLWLKQAVGDPEFPESMEEYTAAMVERYGRSVDVWSPSNEPLVCALFSGDFGFWPPHGRKWRGYMPVLSRIVQAVNRGIRAIRRTKPEATILLCDAAEHYKTRHASLATEVRRRNLRRFLVLDLLTGRVDQHHPLHGWLTAYGMSELDLEWFRNNPQTPDVLGLDYYTHSDWQLDVIDGSVRQRRSENPAGVYGIGSEYYQRYGIPLMLTETSVEGQPINREIWLESTVDDVRRLREDGVPMLGYIWWPLIDQIDWDGALTHRIGKVHQVGLYNLQRQPDGILARIATPLAGMFRDIVSGGEERVGTLEKLTLPTETAADQGPPLGIEYTAQTSAPSLVEMPLARKNGNGNAKGKGRISGDLSSATVALETETTAAPDETIAASEPASIETLDHDRFTDRYGIVVFSHLRWGFVWQRPQQFLCRFARRHKILFVEEPFFDLREDDQPHTAMHCVMPNVTVAAPHMPPSMNRNIELPGLLRKLVRDAIADANQDGEFDRPLLWYYSPMDSAWSLGHFENRGVVYDSMDELSQFSGAPRTLLSNEQRLLDHADIVFTGGYELHLKKKDRHPNVHFFGCGVEFEHFARAMDENTTIPPDIDFMARPILGWFGVIDERVDYSLVGEIARAKPEWSVAMVGPVVKVDPDLLPHAPNLFWLGQRDYQVLPNYCRAFDIAIMPFAINAATQYINPTKVLEYMATGRPIISTPVRDVVRQYGDLVYIANNSAQFIEQAARFLAQPDEDRIRLGLEKARANSWDSTVKAMQALIKEAVIAKDRPSQRPIAPLPDMEIAYNYQATPGS